jgi:uncharacterized protein YodC (DUF2158 family)
MDAIKNGSIVTLKSGSPKMTVDKIYNSDGGPRASCDWFEDTKHIHGNFPITSLKLESE